MRYRLVVLSVLILFQSTKGFSTGNLLNPIYAGIANLANEFDRIFELLRGRQDFNSWFLKNKIEDVQDEEFDFIIVGSGPAGSVIANRLSEIADWKVLILEAGEPETALMDVPILAPLFLFTDYNWGYLMEEELPNFQGLDGNRMAWPRGKALGGTSTINFMIATRGNRWDYDKWAAAGNPGWSYEDVLPYFMKSEDVQLKGNFEKEYHGSGGYQTVENIYHPVLMDAVINASNEIGYPTIDYNANNSLGVSGYQALVRNGSRLSSANAFLWPARQRSNLEIKTGAFVTKLLINETTNEAYGVEYVRKKRSYTVYAKKEVILSAGTFNSAKLLMLAGIGPKDDLEELGIPCRKNLPVGKNIQDHLTFIGLPLLINENVELNVPRVVKEVPTYLANHTGILSCLGGTIGLLYAKTDVAMAEYEEDYPDFEFIVSDGSIADDLTVNARSFRIRPEIFISLFGPTIFDHKFSIIPMHMHPKSVGYLKLRSTDPYDTPILHGNFFSDPDGYDIKSWVSAIRIVEKLINTTALQDFGTRLSTRKIYLCEELEFDTDEYWECVVRAMAVTLHHQVGTARMGPENNNSVVNHNLQVYGISRLRVADCSIIPNAIGAHTNVPSLMIGEKASDIIKDYYGLLNATETES